MEALFNLGNLLTMLITALATWGGTFLFYKQEKRSKDIDNEAKQSEEWRKLYLDSQEDSRKKEEDSRKKDEKIDELRKEMSDMRRQMNNLERRVILNSIYRCNRVDCSNREPKPDETQRLSMEEQTIKHFTLEELTDSATAKRLHINNTPSSAEIVALTALCVNVLEPLRKHWGGPILVNSGYRSPALNAAVKGATASQHMKGEAADIRASKASDNMRLYHTLRTLFPYDQIIAEEYDVATGQCGWVHVSFRSTGCRKNALIKYKGKKGYFYWK
ncbi:unnamed protein product [Cylicocyclus nassatus]|uniref:Peptidase M15A C-terminal domain-containing protein n=1 Tax=Cylicocyclus nassatus TaxID=53992 RepID=A0AA36DRX4_CYLNA|nr:unnamed protein product [Cylicocyclus nassatus]